MLGVVLSVLAAGTFALNATAARRAVLTGSVLQGLAITVPLGVPLFWLIAWAAGEAGDIARFPLAAVAWFAAAGIVHFVIGRYSNYAAAGAIGNNLAAPLLQCEVLVTLALAMTVLGETLTPLRLIGIVLVLIGPSLVMNRGATRSPATFSPRYLEGYAFAALAALAYGSSPILIGLGLKAGLAATGRQAALAGGVVSYLAATVAVGVFLLATRQSRSIYRIEKSSLGWFVFAGVCVAISQIFRYAAMALAPVSVVTALQRLSSIFRIYFGWAINREHEVFDRSVILATVVSMIGAIALSISTEMFLSLAPWPAWVHDAAHWTWR